MPRQPKKKQDAPLHVLSLQVENFQRIKVAEIHPDGSLVVLKGPNGAGKSSILDGLVATLGGKRGIAAEPLHRGATAGSTTVELGPEGGPPVLIARRRYTDKGPGELRLEVPDEGPMTGAQTVLDKIIGDLSFDPEAFRLMVPKARAEQLLSVVGLDFKELDGQRQRVFDRRTEVGRAQKRAATLAADARPEDKSESFHPVPQEALEHLETAVEDSRLAIEAGNALHTAVNTARHSHTSAQAVTARSKEALLAGRREVERQIEAVTALEERLRQDADGENVAMNAVASAELDAEEAQLGALGSAHEEARQILEHARGENLERGRVYDLEQTLVRLTEESHMQNQRWAALSEEINGFDKKKRDALAAAEFPVPGLSITEGGAVLLDGLPWDQASESDQLRISVAMAMALNPTLRVAIIKRGSGLDPEQVARIQELVAAVGGQVFIEMVYTSDEQGSIVEVTDGEAHS